MILVLLVSISFQDTPLVHSQAEAFVKRSFRSDPRPSTTSTMPTPPTTHTTTIATTTTTTTPTTTITIDVTRFEHFMTTVVT